MRSSRRGFLGQTGAAIAAFVLAGCDTSSDRNDGATRPIGLRVIEVGRVDELLATMERTQEPVYVPEARAYVSPYPADALDAARETYPKALWPVLEAGVIVLDQRCTHLQCKTPFCSTSQWFECPCHGAKFNRVGEKKDGPAPRGLDLWTASVADGVLWIDTSGLYDGMPIGTNTTGQVQEGPSCI